MTITSSTVPAAQSTARGWIVTLCALSINLVLGVLYAWSVIGRALVQQRGWSKTEAALPFAVSTGAFALTMIFAGRAQDKLGPRYVAMLGGLMLGIGLITSAWADSPMLMMLTYGVLGGIGIGLGYSATTPPSVKWFPPARKGLITGIVVAGVGLAAVYMSPLTQWLVGLYGVAHTLMILGVGAIIVVCTLALALRNPPPGYVPPALPAGSAAVKRLPAGQDADWNAMLGTGRFYLLWIVFILAASAGLMLIANAAMIADVQAAWKGGFYLVMTLAIFNTLGRIVGGWVSDRLGRSNTMSLFFLIQAANMFFFARYNTPALLLFGVALAGLCYGTIFTLMPAATADFYGLKNLGVNYGILFTAFGVAGVLGSLLGGRVADWFGSYQRAYLSCAIMLVVAAVLALATRARKV